MELYINYWSYELDKKTERKILFSMFLYVSGKSVWKLRMERKRPSSSRVLLYVKLHLKLILLSLEYIITHGLITKVLSKLSMNDGNWLLYIGFVVYIIISNHRPWIYYHCIHASVWNVLAYDSFIFSCYKKYLAL